MSKNRHTNNILYSEVLGISVYLCHRNEEVGNHHLKAIPNYT